MTRIDPVTNDRRHGRKLDQQGYNPSVINGVPVGVDLHGRWQSPDVSAGSRRRPTRSILSWRQARPSGAVETWSSRPAPFGSSMAERPRPAPAAGWFLARLIGVRSDRASSSVMGPTARSVIHVGPPKPILEALMRRMRSLLLSIGLAAALAGADARALSPPATPDSTTAGSRSASAGPTAPTSSRSVPDGTGQKQLTKGAGFHLCPSFSPDGRTIAYCSNVSGSWEIWTMRANGSKQRQLTHLDGFATFPDFSPDGKTMPPSAGPRGPMSTPSIYAVNAKTGGGLHALTSCAGLADGCFNDLPLWSPDGTRIAFMHWHTHDPILDAVVDEQVWVMDADGGNPHPITTRQRPEGPGPRTGAPTARRSRTTPEISATAGSGSSMPMVATTTRSAAASPVTRRRAPRAMTGARPGHRTARRSCSCVISRPSAPTTGPSTSWTPTGATSIA